MLAVRALGHGYAGLSTFYGGIDLSKPDPDSVLLSSINN